MRSIAFVTLGLFACADEEKVIALEKQVADLKSELESTRKDLDKRIDELEDRKDVTRQIDDLTSKLDKLDDKLRTGSTGSYVPTPRPPRIQPDAAQVYSVAVDGYPTIGPADAKVTIVKAYDHACPYCEKTRPTMQDLRDKYRGDVRIVYKPLVVHPRNAMAGALATCAAHKQGKFAEMDAAIWDKGFATRAFDLSDSPGGQGMKCWDEPDGCRLVVGYAKDLQLNVTKFKKDMRDCMPKVMKSMADFQALSVSATPGFFINGRFLSGAQPLDTFVRLVDEELRKAHERIAQGTPARSYYENWIVNKGKTTVDPPSAVPGIPGVP